MSEQENRKRGGIGSIIYKIVVLILVCVIGFSLYKIGTILWGYWQGTQTYNEVAKVGDIKKGNDEIKINWKKLLKKYPDIKAWIYCKGTVLNYPVVQGKDNSQYLHRMINGEWNAKGTLFLDARHKKIFKEFPTIIYGHHMHDGTMFGSLVKYREDKYYRKHKTIKLYTPKQNYNMEIIGVCTIPAKSERYDLAYEDDESKQEYLNWIDEATETKCEATATVDDDIVMLSTCTYEYDNARCVVYGKLVPNEDAPN